MIGSKCVVIYKHIIIGSFSSYADAAVIVQSLGNVDFDLQKLSIISIGSERGARSHDAQIRLEIIREKSLKYVGTVDKGRFVVLSGTDQDILRVQQSFKIKEDSKVKVVKDERSPQRVMNKVLCYYVNSNLHPEVARVSCGSSVYLERTISPLQQIVFEAPPEAQLEIFTSEMASMILSDRISCHELQILEPSNPVPTVQPELLNGNVKIKLTTLTSFSLQDNQTAPKSKTFSPAH
jgi:hypothetical protein